MFGQPFWGEITMAKSTIFFSPSHRRAWNVKALSLTTEGLESRSTRAVSKSCQAQP
jgi:hypothetical protein